MFISPIGAAPFTLTVDDARPEITGVSAPAVHRQVILQNVPSDAVLSTDYVSFQVSGDIPTRTPLALPTSIAIGIRSKTAATNDPCEALSTAYAAPSSSSATNPMSPQVTPVGTAGTTILAFFRPADLLTTRAAGALQLQLIDNGAGVGSDWVSVPGLIVTEAPDIESVTCDNGEHLCTVVGTQLQTIQSVFDENGKSVLQGFCAPPAQGKQCIQLTQSKVFRVQLSGLTSMLTINQTFIKTPPPQVTKQP